MAKTRTDKSTYVLSFGGLQLDMSKGVWYTLGDTIYQGGFAMGNTAFTVTQCAEYLGISRQAVHYLCKRGRLRWWIFGCRMMISRSSAASYKLLREKLAEADRRRKEEGAAKNGELKRRRGKRKREQAEPRYWQAIEVPEEFGHGAQAGG